MKSLRVHLTHFSSSSTRHVRIMVYSGSGVLGLMNDIHERVASLPYSRGRLLTLSRHETTPIGCLAQNSPSRHRPMNNCASRRTETVIRLVRCGAYVGLTAKRVAVSKTFSHSGSDSGPRLSAADTGMTGFSWRLGLWETLRPSLDVLQRPWWHLSRMHRTY